MCGRRAMRLAQARSSRKLSSRLATNITAAEQIKARQLPSGRARRPIRPCRIASMPRTRGGGDRVEIHWRWQIAEGISFPPSGHPPLQCPRPQGCLQTACVSRRMGCASRAGLPADARGAPYPVPKVAPVAQHRRDRNDRASRGLPSTQRVPSSCSLVPPRPRAIAMPASRCLPACRDAKGGRRDYPEESR